MLFLQKPSSFIFGFLLFVNPVLAQQISRVLKRDSVSLYLMPKHLAFDKNVPTDFKDVIYVALQYYPELSGTEIKFRIKKTKAPLAARPTIWAIFTKPSKRKYIITISSSTNSKLDSILLKNLSYNSQVGVIGHELAHIAFYSSKRGIYFVELVVKHLSKIGIDKFEFNTDSLCIEHGLGFQLLSWSREVRTKLDLKQWGGSNSPKAKRERYMNPETIINHMNLRSIYKIEVK